MVRLPKILSKKLLTAFVCTIVVAGGCRPKPEILIADPSERPATAAEGKRLLEQGRAVDAVTAYRKQLRLEGADLQSLNGLAIAYGELGRVDLATEMFSRALAMAPDDPATLNNIGFAALRRTDLRLARHYLEKARERSDGDSEIEGNLKGLTWLEALKRTSSTRRAQRKAGPTLLDGPATQVRRIAISERKPSELSITPTPKVEPSRAPQIAMVDFTAVINPFIQDR